MSEVAAAAVAVARMTTAAAVLVFLRTFGDEALGRQHETGDARPFCSAVRTTFTGSMTPI